MSTSVMKVDGMQVAEVNSKPTQINIHIHQESSLAKLLQDGRAFLQSKIYSQDTLKQSERVLQAQLALGAIIAGAGAIIYEKYQSSCWGWLAALLTLISISTAFAALILCSFSVEDSANHFSNLGEICEPKNSPRSYYRRYDSSDWITEACKWNMDMFLFLFQGIQAMLLVICVVTLLVSLASLGVGLHNLCCQNSQFQVEEGTEKKLLGEESLPPSPCKEKSIGIISL
ncbi:transmembrane protein 176B isoform X2 [Petaurus breviceps papuanus]|uniref:transmembrane protein 176B isoform X2 n=1 Tax=Petaurus breviceps papuanus TaxID=3040969 RepID=UPI0036DEB09B